jgi:hypothetical protein
MSTITGGTALPERDREMIPTILFDKSGIILEDSCRNDYSPGE